MGAPELVMKILFSVDRELALKDKIADFYTIGVNECWVVRPQRRTVKVLHLTQDGPQTSAT